MAQDVKAVDVAQVRAALELMTRAGLWVEAPKDRMLTTGSVPVSAENIELWFNDKDAFYADEAQVSLEHYKQWAAWVDCEYPCTGIGADGTPCDQTLGPSLARIDPAVFVPGESDRCVNHKTG